MLLYAILGYFLFSIISSVAVRYRSEVFPSVIKLSQGTFIGDCSGAQGICSWRGIPYAVPPVGELRLAPPQPVKAAEDTFNATATPLACSQMPGSFNFSALPLQTLKYIILATGSRSSPLQQGEDCLTANVYRSSELLGKTLLPVVVWIHGGGFQTGSASTYEPTILLDQANRLKMPLIYVSINYRLVCFTFQFEAEH